VPKLITVQEAAELLRVHPRTVMNMAKRGELPGSKIGKQWRFDLEAVEAWIANSFRQPTPLPAPQIPPREYESVIGLLPLEMIRCVDALGSRVEVLESLSAILSHSRPGVSFESVYQALLQREEMHPTAVDGGIAFPHPRRPLSALPGPLLAALLVRSGVPFGAPDGHPTFFFVCICAPDDSAHVTILARLAHLFRRDGAVARVKKAEEPGAVLEAFRTLERSANAEPAEIEV